MLGNEKNSLSLFSTDNANLHLSRHSSLTEDAAGRGGDGHGKLPSPRTSHVTKEQIHDLSKNKGVRGPALPGFGAQDFASGEARSNLPD